MVSLRCKILPALHMAAVSILVSGLLCAHFSAFADSGMQGMEATPSPMQFFGFDLGGREADLQNRFAGVACAERVCTMQESSNSHGSMYTLGDASITSWSAASDDGRVGWFSGSFAQSSYPQVIKALVARYGPPTTTVTDGVQNHGSNEVVDSQRSMWDRPDGLLVVRERVSNSANGELMMRATWYLPAVTARKQAEFKAQPKSSQQ